MVSNAVFILANAVCEKQGLSGTLLKGCVYDVVVSNDTALAEQEALKKGRLLGITLKAHLNNISYIWITLYMMVVRSAFGFP